MKQCRNVYDVLAMYNTCSMVLYILCIVYLLWSNYVVKKGHEQVEKTLEMKKME